MNYYDLGKVGITDGGRWRDNVAFERLTWVLYDVDYGGDGCGYVALKDNIGVTPGTDPTTWAKAAQAGQSIYQLCVAHGTFVGTEEEFVAAYNAAVQAATDAASAANTKMGQFAEAENARVLAEQGRVSAENARVLAEQGRVSAEQQRVLAEQGRVNAETARVNEFDRKITACETATGAANDAASLANEKANLANQKAGLANEAAAAANAAAQAAGALQENLEDGDVVPALAENLASWAEEDGLEVSNEWTDTIRTTAGDDPIVTENGGKLLGVRAVSDFVCSSLLTTPYNQLRLASANGGAVAIGSGWYFPVPKLTFGAYGSAEENNGIVFTDNNHEDVTGLVVRFKPLASGVPTSDTDGTQLTAQSSKETANTNGGIYTDHDIKFYLTPGPGYLIVTGITYANVCAHFGWEDWYDKFVSPTAEDDLGDSINLAPLFAAAPNGTGKFLVVGGAATNAERISETQMLITDPVARITSPSWTNSAVEGGYKHELTIPAMKPDGAVVIEGSAQSLTVEGTTISYTDENATAISGAVRYELLVPATATATLAKTSYALNDCGIEMKVGAEGIAAFSCSYSQNVPDALSQIAKIRVGDIAGDVEALQAEQAREGTRMQETMDFRRMPMLYGQPAILFSNGAPTAQNKPTNWLDFMDGGYEWTGLPNAVGQHILDYTNHINYYGWLNPSTGLLEWKY